MSNKILIRRGPKATIPQLDVGELGYTTDTPRPELYVGTPSGNKDLHGLQGPPGPKGDSFKYEDFTGPQLESLRGPKGEDFKYEDFTESQLEGLRGPQGEPPDLEDELNVATSYQLIKGALDSGTLEDTHELYTENFLLIKEVSGTPGGDIRFNFTNVERFNRLRIHVRYYGDQPGHNLFIQLYDYVAGDFVQLTFFQMSKSFLFYDLPVNDSRFIEDGEAIVRFYHPAAGNTTHRFAFDYVGLIQSFTGSQGPKGETGAGMSILGTLSDISELPATGEAGDAYLIDGDLWVWAEVEEEFVNVGSIQGPPGKDGEDGEDADFSNMTSSDVTTALGYTPVDSNDIVDDLITDDDKKVLSANQGVELKGLIDGLNIPTEAAEIGYDNANSGLEADNVQDAIDEHLADNTTLHNDTNHYFYVQLSTNQSIPNNIKTQIAFNAKTSNGFFVGEDSSIKVAYSGIYLVVARVVFASNSTGKRAIFINSYEDFRNAVQNDATRVLVSRVLNLAANGTIKVEVEQSSGGALEVLSGATQLHVVKLK